MKLFKNNPCIDIYNPPIMIHADGTPTLEDARFHTARGCAGLGSVVGEGDSLPVFVDLTHALRTVEGDRGICNDLFQDIFLKLKRKWAAAARTYREEHPGALPDTKHGRAQHKVPIEDARELLRTWVPWALVRIQEDYARLARRYDNLSPEQLSAIDALPDHDDEDEDGDEDD